MIQIVKKTIVFYKKWKITVLSTLSTMSFSKLLKLIELHILYWIYTVCIVCACVRGDRSYILRNGDTRGVIALWIEHQRDPQYDESNWAGIPSFATHFPPH